MSCSKIYFNTAHNEADSYSQCNQVFPSERMGHICQSYDDKYLILWGGHRFDDSRNEKLLDPALIWVFNTEIENWSSIECKNNPPLLSGACSILTNHCLYIFGGCKRSIFGGFTDFHFNDLYKLCLRTLIWEKCHVANNKMPSPRDKLAGWNYDNKLYFFGGFGANFQGSFLNEFGDFDEIPNYNKKLGWNNQLIYFDLETNTWHEQKYSCVNREHRPKPRAAHTCTKINEHQVVLFGGRTLECRSNDLYILNLKDFCWTENLMANKDNSPTGRSWHTMVALNNNHVFLYGGLSQENQCIGDGWLLNTIDLNWIKIKTDFEQRLWHTAAVNRKDNQVYVFGGSVTDVFVSQPTFPKHMFKISLSPESLKMKCINFICSNKINFSSKSHQIPFELEKCIRLKYLANAPVQDVDNSNMSRSEYCVLQ